jgi:hypothetical protein
MNYINLLKVDLEFGEKNEDYYKIVIEKYFNCPLEKTNKTAIFDFVNKEKKISIEMKSRNNNKDKYPTTMIGYNKIIESVKKINEGWTIYFVFKFTDCIAFYKFEEDNTDWHSIGGRRDRFKNEFKEYYFIPVSELKTITELYQYSI